MTRPPQACRLLAASGGSTVPLTPRQHDPAATKVRSLLANIDRASGRQVRSRLTSKCGQFPRTKPPSRPALPPAQLTERNELPPAARAPASSAVPRRRRPTGRPAREPRRPASTTAPATATRRGACRAGRHPVRPRGQPPGRCGSAAPSADMRGPADAHRACVDGGSSERVKLFSQARPL